jgi:hypothetical protein
MVNLLEQIFPRLATGNYQVTSPKNEHYNCIAWAAGDTANWWWPGPDPDREYWPTNVVREETLAGFVALFSFLGYVVCAGEDLEESFERIALFADAQGQPTHAARQLPSGLWSSKLGKLEDIEHALHDLEGTAYGTVMLLMKRSIPAEDSFMPG